MSLGQHFLPGPESTTHKLRDKLEPQRRELVYPTDTQRPEPSRTPFGIRHEGNAHLARFVHPLQRGDAIAPGKRSRLMPAPGARCPVAVVESFSVTAVLRPQVKVYMEGVCRRWRTGHGEVRREFQERRETGLVQGLDWTARNHPPPTKKTEPGAVDGGRVPVSQGETDQPSGRHDARAALTTQRRTMENDA